MATDSLMAAALAGLTTNIMTDIVYYPFDIIRAKIMGSNLT